MALLERVVDRRRFLQGLGTGAAGLTGAAILGCESSNPQELNQKLLSTQISPEDLPDGIISRGITAAPIDNTLKAFDAIGVININVSDLKNKTSYGGIAYTIFKNSKGASQGLEATKNNPLVISMQDVKDDELPSSATTVKINTFGGTLDLVVAVIDNVMVASVFSNPQKVVNLEKAAIKHLKKVK